MNDSGPKLGKRRIQKFERDTGITLPTDYRDFLLKHNGGYPTDCRFEIPELREDAQLDFLFAIDTPGYLNLEERLAAWKDEMPKGFLTIGCDPGGAYIIMGTTGKYAGRVYFWDHQHFYLQSSSKKNTYLVATSFSKFLGSLVHVDSPSRWDTDVPKAADLIRLTLSHADGILPAQMARLATDFARVAKPRAVVGQLLRQLFDHKSPDVRRVAVGACRRIMAFDVPGLQEALVKKLADRDAWVRYDAAWTIREAGYDSAAVRKALGRLAKGISLPKDAKKAENDPSNAELQARVGARKTLDALLARSKQDGNS